MNKEQQELLDDVYKNFKEQIEHGLNSMFLVNDGPNKITPLTQEEFINKCKTDKEFSERWGLKIEERELDMFERWKIADLTPNMMEIDYCNKLCDEHNVPTKLITITYNDKIVESYE